MHLLDVNVLIARADESHPHHHVTAVWMRRHAGSGWATCPLTQNAVLRILSNPRYPNSPGSPAAVMPLLHGLLAHPDQVFWPDDISWSFKNLIHGDQLLGHAQIIDTYLLALAVQHQGCLVSLDSRLSTLAVYGGENALRLIPVSA